ncbi:MAG: 50S ribosomal protein L10 [bacterium]|nr:50S ribosomal protein L10 [bacterium]
MLTKPQKQKIVKDLSQELISAKGIVFTSFQGLTTKDSQELRRLLRKENVQHKVVKITLVKKALERSGISSDGLSTNLPMAVSWSLEDEVMAAKILSTFAKAHESLKIVSGILDKKFLDAATLKQLAALPGKLELRGQLVGVLASPLRGLVTVLSGNIRGFLNVLNARMQTVK